MAERTRVAVVGSCNLDQIVTAREFPAAGTTVAADDLFEEPGGKGLNQALAAAHAGARVDLVGAVGGDAAGTAVRAALDAGGVGVTAVRESAAPTGRALVLVDASGDNRIIVLAGANAELTTLTAADRALVSGADALLLQLELPQSVAIEAAETAVRAGVLVALTPAPVQPLSERLLAALSILFVNEHEARSISGRAEVADALAGLLDLVPAVVVTRGALGSEYADRAGLRLHCPAPEVAVVDTTAAGDTYAGVMVTALAGGTEVGLAMRQASAAAARVVGRRGSSGAILAGPLGE